MKQLTMCCSHGPASVSHFDTYLFCIAINVSFKTMTNWQARMCLKHQHQTHHMTTVINNYLFRFAGKQPSPWPFGFAHFHCEPTQRLKIHVFSWFLVSQKTVNTNTNELDCEMEEMITPPITYASWPVPCQGQTHSPSSHECWFSKVLQMPLTLEASLL